MILSTQRKNGKPTYGPGIYVNEVTIVEAENISGQLLPFLDNPVDIGLKLTLDIGRNFQPDFIIAGNFKRDPDTNDVIDWGGAFVVQDALSRLGHEGNLTVDNRIPAEAIDGLPGQRFLRLSYISGVRDDGRLRYFDWNQIATLEEGPASLVNRFKKSLAKGYPKNYRPELLDAISAVTQIITRKEEDPF